MTDRLSLLAAAALAGDSRDEYTRYLMRAGWSEEDADTAAWEYEQQCIDEDGEPPWSSPSADRRMAQIRTADMESRAEAMC